MNHSPEIPSQESNFRKRKLAPNSQIRPKGSVRTAFDKPFSSAPSTKSNRAVKKTTEGSKGSKPN